jgi:predicted Zn-dependent protease
VTSSSSPSRSDYLNAINATNILNAYSVITPGALNAIPDGYTLLYSSTSDARLAGMGLNGTAYYNSATGNVILAMAGPNTVSASSGSNNNPTLIAAATKLDQLIANNNPAATAIADQATAEFYSKVSEAAQAAGITLTTSNTFTTGNSEGGYLAQVMAQTYTIGGEAYGAPGVVGYDASTTPSNSGFTVWNNPDDPIGNYSSNGAIPPQGSNPQYNFGAVQLTSGSGGSSSELGFAASLFESGDGTSAESGGSQTSGFLMLAMDAGLNHPLQSYFQAFGITPNVAPQASFTTSVDSSALSFLGLPDSADITQSTVAWDSNGNPTLTTTYADGTTSTLNYQDMTPSQYLILYQTTLDAQPQPSASGWVQDDVETGVETSAAVNGSETSLTVASVGGQANDAQTTTLSVNADGGTTVSTDGAYLVIYVTSLDGQPQDTTGWIQIASNDPTIGLANGQGVTIATTSGQDLSAGGDQPGIVIDAAGGNSISVDDSATVIASDDQVFSASGSTLSLAGDFDTITGPSEGACTLTLTGSGEQVSAADSAITLDGSDSAATVGGADDSLQMQGSYQTLTASGSGDSIGVADGGTAEEIAASGATINGATITNSNIFGSDDTLNLSTTGGSNVGFWGTDDTVNAQGDVFDNYNVWTTLTVNGANNNVELLESGQTLYANGSGDTIGVGDGGTSEAIAASDATINGATITNSNIFGSDDTFNLSTNGGSNVGIIGTDDTVNAQNDLFDDYNDWTALTVNGANNTVELMASDQTLDATGSSNSINVVDGGTDETITGSNQTIHLSGDDLAVTIYGSNDVVNSSYSDDTVSFDGAGDTAQLSDGTVNLDGNDQSVTVDGASDWVTSTGASDWTILNGSSDTGNAAGASDVIDAYGASDIVSYNALNDSGTLYGASDTAYVNGSSDWTNETGAGDWTVLYGSGDTGNAVGANDVIDAHGESDTANYNGSNDVGTLYGASDIANVNYASDWSTALGANDSTYLNGSNDTGNAYGAGDWIVLYGSSDSGNDDGANEVVDAHGDSDTANYNGANDVGTLYGTSDTANVNYASDWSTALGASDWTNLNSSNDVGNDDGANEVVDAHGNSDTANYNGANDVGTLYGADDTANVNYASDWSTALGSSDWANLNSSNDTGNAYGADDWITLYGSNDTGNDDGASEVVDARGNSDTANYDGSNDAGTLYGASDLANANGADDWVNIVGSGDSFDASGSGDSYGGDPSSVDGFEFGGDSDTTYYDGSDDDGDSDGYGDGDDDGGGDGGDYDFVSGAKGGARKGGAPSGGDIGVIASYDASVANNPAAARAADLARRDALQTAQSSSSSASARFEGATWSGRVITWSLADSAGTAASPFSGYLSATYEPLVEQAFQAWAAASGLTFEQVSDSAQSDIRIGWGAFDTATSGVIGYTNYQSSAGQMQPDAIIRLEDPQQDPLVAGADGQLTYSGTQSSALQVLKHEIGHALGLADNADPNSIMYYASGPGDSTLDLTDADGINALYGSQNASISSTPNSATEESSLHRLIQAMAIVQGPSSGSAARFHPAEAFDAAPLGMSQHPH